MPTTSFVDVVTGNPTNATNVNQLVDALNGNAAAQVSLLSPANSTTPFFAHLPSAPATSDLTTVQSDVTGDAAARIGFYIRSADGYGGIRGGVGASITAHLYATSTGWAIPEGLSIAGTLAATNITASGTTPFANASPSGVTVNVGPTQPGTAKKWDVWYKTPFS